MIGTGNLRLQSSNSSLHLPPLRGSLSESLIPGHRNYKDKNFFLSSVPQPWRPRRCGMGNAITMRDRSKNRRPTQRGRYLSIEGIQAVQALKRAKTRGGQDSVASAIETKVRRLVKFDLMAVLRELQSQGEGLLAFQVFEELRKEHWYKPQLSIYVGIMSVLAKNGLQKKVEQLISYLMMEQLTPDTEGFNLLLETLLEFGFTQKAMDCFRLMKLWDSEPDESTFSILIKGLESHGDMVAAAAVRDEAERKFGGYLVFLEEHHLPGLTNYTTNPQKDTEVILCEESHGMQQDMNELKLAYEMLDEDKWEKTKKNLNHSGLLIT